MSHSDSLWLTPPLIQYEFKWTALWPRQWLIQQIAFAWLSEMLLAVCHVGCPPTWHLMTWSCTLYEESTYQLHQVQKLFTFMKWPGSKMANLCALTTTSYPAGVSSNDLDASVKFEFPFPSTVRIFQTQWLLMLRYLFDVCRCGLMNSFMCVGGGPEGQDQHCEKHQQSRI